MKKNDNTRTHILNKSQTPTTQLPNKVKKVYPPITEENIMEIAGKAAYRTVTNQFKLSPSKSLIKLLNGFAYIQDPHSDTADLKQEAATALWEHRDEPKAFIDACNAVRCYIYHQYEKKSRQIINSTDNDGKDDELTNVKDERICIEAETANKEMIENIYNALKSPEQRKIFQYKKLGVRNKEIAEKIGITPARVSQHFTRIREIARSMYPNGMN